MTVARDSDVCMNRGTIMCLRIKLVMCLYCCFIYKNKGDINSSEIR